MGPNKAIKIINYLKIQVSIYSKKNVIILNLYNNLNLMQHVICVS